MKIVFMLGHAHAGNTWLQMWLGDHPEIFTAFESRLFYSLFDLYKNLTARHNAWHTKESARRVLRDTAINLLSSSPRYHNEEMMLEMTPGHGEFLDFINMLFPDAYFLITQRDGRRVIASKKKRCIRRSAFYLMQTLQHDVDLWVKRSAQILSVVPKRSLRVPYVDACSNSEEWGNRILDFLGMKKHKQLVAWEQPWEGHNAIFLDEDIYSRPDRGEDFWMEYLTPDEIAACSPMTEYIRRFTNENHKKEDLGLDKSKGCCIIPVNRRSVC